MAIGPGPVLEETAARFALLGDATRLLLVSLLLEPAECSVTGLVDAAAISVANTSQHLRRQGRARLLGNSGTAQ